MLAMQKALLSLAASLGGGAPSAAARAQHAAALAWAQQRGLHASAAAQDSASAGGASRTFTQFSVTKGSAALTFKVIAPTFRPQSSPSGAVSHILAKEGALFLEFAPLLQKPAGPTAAAAGARSYDWPNKLTFALAPVEVAKLADADHARVEAAGVEFYHDPNKGHANQAAAVRTSKRLKVQPNPQEPGGFLVTLTQSKEGAPPVAVTVPVSRPEFLVLKHLAAYLVPRLLGFDLIFESAAASPPLPESQEATA